MIAELFRAKIVPTAVVACSWALAAQPALACAVCSAREDAQRVAFIATTVFLSALPLGLVFGVAWWLRKRVREQAAASLRMSRLGPARQPQKS